MPRLALLATGGTIAGTGHPDRYTAGALDVSALLAAQPALATLAQWQAEQILSLDSRDMLPEHWLLLAQRIHALQSDDSIDGIVITHGTDTLEETAFALHLLLSAGKPVILTAAMRPATSVNADGPNNLLQAARIALCAAAGAYGPLVVAHGQIIAARDLAKTHTHAIDALRPRAGGHAIGRIAAETIRLQTASVPHTALLSMPSAKPLPRVDILYGYAGISADLPALCVQAGARGLVLALTGQGSIPTVWREPLLRCIQTGILVVRSTRIESGGVRPNCNDNDDTTGFLASCELTPQQARVLLILALASEAPQPLKSLFARA